MAGLTQGTTRPGETAPPGRPEPARRTRGIEAIADTSRLAVLRQGCVRSRPCRHPDSWAALSARPAHPRRAAGIRSGAGHRLAVGWSKVTRYARAVRLAQNDLGNRTY